MWASTKSDEGKLVTFERKILRKIYGPVISVDLGVFERRKMKIYKDFIINRTIAIFLSRKRLE
jgi:hypothetical protein